jgi:predicted transcriptional regulator
MVELRLSYVPFREKYSTTNFPFLHKKYRSHIEIMALILESLKSSGVGQSSIMRRVGLNHLQFKKFLKALDDMGFVEMSAQEDLISYKATGKGLDFLRQYYVLLGMVSSACERTQLARIMY